MNPSATKKNRQSFTRARIEKLIRARSRTSPDLILEAGRAAGNQGWFFLALRLLEGDPRSGRPRFSGFARRWLIAQSRAALGDFTGALEALQLEADATPVQIRKKKAFELIVHLSASEWEQAMAVGAELIADTSASVPSFEKLRGEILYAVAILHGRQDFEGCLKILREVRKGLADSDFAPLEKRALERQLELFWGQCEYLRGNREGAIETWKRALVSERQIAAVEATTGIYQWIFDLWIALAELVNAQDRFPKKLKSCLRRYDECLAGLCRLDSSAVAEQVEGYAAVALGDLSLARQLWLAGTFPGYRIWFESRMDGRLFSSDEDLLVSLLPDLGGMSQLRAIERDFEIQIDAWTGLIQREGKPVGRPLRLKPGQTQQRLFETLVLARYSGLNAFELHRRVFSDEKFNSRTSPAKIRTLVYRLRQELKRAGVGLSISETDERYRLETDRPIQVNVRWVPSSGVQRAVRPVFRPGPRSATGGGVPEDQMLQQVYRQIILLERKFGDREFSAAEALDVLGLKRSRGTAVLSSAVKQGWLKRSHLDRRVRYVCVIAG